MIEYRKFITRQMLRDAPDKLFVFGDNMIRKGYGGQAKQMRGEPTAVGIPTKKLPAMTAESFLTNSDLPAWLEECTGDVIRLIRFNKLGGVIVWPTDGIGTGLARLETSAPEIWNQIERLKRSLTHDTRRI